MYVLVSCNVLDSDGVPGDVVQCFIGVQFNHIALYYLIFVPSLQLWSRLIIRKAQIMAPGQDGGTRHFAAAQFVYDQRDAFALVASQDGRFTIFSWSPCDQIVLAHRVDCLLI